MSKIFSDYIKNESDESLDEELPPITLSMIGVLKNSPIEFNKETYHKHLEEKYL